MAAPATDTLPPPTCMLPISLTVRLTVCPSSRVSPAAPAMTTPRPITPRASLLVLTLFNLLCMSREHLRCSRKQPGQGSREDGRGSKILGLSPVHVMRARPDTVAAILMHGP